jgi:hypothetical protein
LTRNMVPASTWVTVPSSWIACSFVSSSSTCSGRGPNRCGPPERRRPANRRPPPPHGSTSFRVLFRFKVLLQKQVRQYPQKHINLRSSIVHKPNLGSHNDLFFNEKHLLRPG